MIVVLFFFLFGLVIGSFLNVCISRMPAEISVIRPRSFCPACKNAIAFYDNIPVFSYMALGGKCRHCGSSISLMYPVVEVLTGIITAAVFVRWQGGLWWLSAALVLSWTLITLTFIDLKHLIIPDELSLGLVGLGLLTFWINPFLSGSSGYKFA